MRHRLSVKSGMTGLLLLLAAAAAAAGGGCSAKKPPDAMGTLTGTISYQEPVALSPDAVAYVRLADTTKGTVESKTIVQKEIKDVAQVPISFELPYKEKDIDPSREYAVDVRIVDKGKLMLMNPTKYTVITKGSPSALDMTLVVPAARRY
jgi:uncharacterized lipoprotein YbaY